MKYLFVFLLGVLSLFAGVSESKELLNNYVVVNKSLKESLDSELKLIESGKSALTKRVVDTLLKDLIFSSVYIEKEYISGERDLFNNEVFHVLKKIYEREFKELESRYAHNREKHLKTKDALNSFKTKLKKLEKREKDLQRLTLKSQRGKFNATVFEKLDTIVSKMFIEEEDTSEIFLDDFSPPAPSFKVIKSSHNYALLDLKGEKDVMVVNDGKIVFVEDSEELGFVVIVKHKQGVFSIYGYLNKISSNIKIGQRLYQGEKIGEVKENLLFKLTHNNTPIDIQLFMEE